MLHVRKLYEIPLTKQQLIEKEAQNAGMPPNPQ
jgi:hypothetical protein